MTGRARVELADGPETPRTARRFVTDQLDRWGYSSLIADAALLTSELVANAVRHATGPYAIEVVDLRDGVLVTVEDADPELPAAGYPGPEAESGRGLAIVESVGAAWGASAAPTNGKVVWFRLAASPG